MPDKIDKTRNEQEGEHSFVGTGVGIDRVVTQEVLDLKKKINEEIEQAIINNDITQEFATLIIGRQEGDHNAIWEEITNIWNAIHDLQSIGLTMCRVEQGTKVVHGFVQNVWTLAEHDDIEYDVSGLYSIATSKITIPAEGNYYVGASATWANGDVGDTHGIRIRRSDKVSWVSDSREYSNETLAHVETSGIDHFTAGVELHVDNILISGNTASLDGGLFELARIS